MTKLRHLCAVAALAATSGTALAETTANVGVMSDYIFRGVYQSESAAFAGIDLNTERGFYLGTWGAALKDGLEYDIYLGYEGGGENFQWYAGLTGYYYTDDFDNTYEEINLGMSYGFLSLDIAVGDYSHGFPPGVPIDASSRQSYTYVGAMFEPETGPYYFIGRTDFKNIDRNPEPPMPPTPSPAGRIPATGGDGYWLEIGKSFEILPDFDVNIAMLYSGDVPQEGSSTLSTIQLAPSPNADAEYALTATFTKTIRMGN